jgi:hypothetical protein
VLQLLTLNTLPLQHRRFANSPPTEGWPSGPGWAVFNLHKNKKPFSKNEEGFI